MDSEKLLACPWCGGEPTVVENDSYNGCGISCSICDVMPDQACGVIGTLDQCIIGWNARSPTPENGLREALERAKRDIQDLPYTNRNGGLVIQRMAAIDRIDAALQHNTGERGDEGNHLSAAENSHKLIESTEKEISPPEGIPSALFQAIGSIVSMCAEERTTCPDDATAIDAITDCINELYGCLEGGVFGQIAADPFPLAEEAFEEALKRYPDAHGGLVFLWGASGLGFRNPTTAQLEWARDKMKQIEARTNG